MTSDGWQTPGNTAGLDEGPGSMARVAVRMKLGTSRECSKALARLTRAALGGKISTSDLSRYANALLILSRLIEGSDAEARLEALERKMGIAA